MSLRLLLLADTHLGFDMPERPRVERVRRGPDFFANTRRALEGAREGRVDLVVHGGDLLYRSRVSPALVTRALEPLLEVADTGVPVVLVPGNHERSAIPFPLLAAHRHLHVFDRPRTVSLDAGPVRVNLVGFPCERNDIRRRFRDLLARAEAEERAPADVRLLCLHQTVEGATVGPVDYCFRAGADVIRGADLPGGYAAVLAGHIHRHQVLERDLAGRLLPAPVFYPGSVERTSAAERDEEKGALVIELEADADRGGRVPGWRFDPLPTRPMETVTITPATLDPDGAEARLAAVLAGCADNAVIQLRVSEPPDADLAPLLRAANLRRLAGPDQIVEVHYRRR